MGVRWTSSPERVTLAPSVIDAQLTELEHGGLRRCTRPAVAQGHAHAREELVHPEWLREIVVRACVERPHLVLLATAGREHDDRHSAPLPDLFGEIDSVTVGQAEVEQDERGIVRRHEGQRVAQPLCLDQSIAVRGEAGADEAPHLGLVLHDEDQDVRLIHGFTESVLGTGGGSAPRGIRSRNPAPPPGRLRAWMEPPWASTTPRQIASPRPTPGTPPWEPR